MGTDALSRVLTAKAADGRTYTDEEAPLEVHHMVIAGFIVYALMAEAMRRLARATPCATGRGPSSGLKSDQLGGVGESPRQVEAERLGGRAVDHQLEFGRRLHRKIGRLLAPQDAVDITCGRAKLIDRVDAV
jgi:hypothetical protein